MLRIVDVALYRTMRIARDAIEACRSNTVVDETRVPSKVNNVPKWVEKFDLVVLGDGVEKRQYVARLIVKAPRPLIKESLDLGEIASDLPGRPPQVNNPTTACN